MPFDGTEDAATLAAEVAKEINRLAKFLEVTAFAHDELIQLENMNTGPSGNVTMTETVDASGFRVAGMNGGACL
jgi:hypothetical protein